MLTSTRRLPLILALCVAAGCTGRRDGLIKQDRAIKAELDALPIPTVQHSELKDLPPALRVAVHDGVVDVDDVALWLTRPEGTTDGPPPTAEDGAPPWTRAKGLSTKPGPDNEYLLPTLHETLRRVRESAKARAEQYDEDFSGRYNLFVTQDTPFEVVVRVLYTLGQVEYGDFMVAARRGETIGGLEVQLPKFCASHLRTARDMTPQCMLTSAFVSDAGLPLDTRSVREHRGCAVFAATGKQLELDEFDSTKLQEVFGDLEGAGLDGALGLDPPGDPPTKAALPKPPSKPPKPEGTDCVFLPRVDAALPVAELGARLAELRGERPLCDSAQLGAANPIPWRDVVTAFDGLLKGGYEFTTLMAGEPPDACE